MGQSAESGSAVRFGLAGQRYLLTADSIVAEIVETENQWIVLSDAEITSETHMSLTRWSDFNTMVPTLFLFYHGMELITKGLLIHHCGELVHGHDLPSLINRLADYAHRNAFVDIAIKYLSPHNETPKFLWNFLDSNRHFVDAGSLSELLRYPESNTGIAFDHTYLQHNENEILADLVGMRADTKQMISIAVAVLRDGAA